MKEFEKIDCDDPFIHFIIKEFSLRREKNASYSLRAFSRSLGLDQSLLSKVINGKRKLSLSKKHEISEKLEIQPSKRDQLCAYPNIAFQFKNLSYLEEDDQYWFLSSWIHPALLELIGTRDFQFDIAWMAKRLGVHQTQIRDSLNRLLRLGLVENRKNKLIVKQPHNSWSNLNSTTSVKKKLQKQYLKKSLNAIDEYSHSEREHGSLTVAIDSSKMKAFKQKLQEMRKELNQFAEEISSNNKDEVYQLCISFFSLTNRRNEL